MVYLSGAVGLDSKVLLVIFNFKRHKN
jgi:hypothetical protein